MSGAAGEMKASLLLTLEDQLTGGLDSLLKTLGGLDEALKRLTQNFSALHIDKPFEQAGRAVAALEEKLGPLGRALHAVHGQWEKMTSGIGAFGAAAGAISFVEPIREYAEYENTLRHIAITRHLSGAAADAEIARLTKLFAEDAQTGGQSSASIAKAYYDFATSGLSADVIDKIIGQHSKAATAYNISAEALGPAVLALIQNMHIPEADILAAIGAMTEAAKSGRFKVEDFAREFPGVSGLMSLLGMTGREGADYGFAALETVMKNSSEPNEAARGLVDALRYITDNAGRMAFQRAGIDLHEIEAEGAKHGRNPLDAVLDFLAKLTKGMNPLDQAGVLGSLLHNQQAALAIQALLQHRDENDALKAGLDKKDASAVATDFATAFNGPIVQLRLFQEALAQLARSVGEMFVPVLFSVTEALYSLKDGVDWLNANFPTATHVVGEFTGIFLALGTAIGALGLLLSAASPVGIGLALLVTVGIEIYRHWDDIKRTFHEFGDQLDAWVHGKMKIAIDDLRDAWGQLREFFTHLWADIRKPFDDFVTSFENSWIGRQLGTGHSTPGATPSGLASQARILGDQTPKIEIHVTADPGLNVRTRSDHPTIMIPKIGMGAMYGDPTLDQVVGRP